MEAKQAAHKKTEPILSCGEGSKQGPDTLVFILGFSARIQIRSSAPMQTLPGECGCEAPNLSHQTLGVQLDGPHRTSVAER